MKQGAIAANRFWRTLCLKLVGAFLLCLVPAGAAKASQRHPNVVVIVLDDLGFSDLGCYGGEIRTPNIDGLAKEGLRFTQFYNCAVCTASRAALLTGVYPRSQGKGELRTDMVTIGELAQRSGYKTALIGKWHLGNAAPRRAIDRGFDEFYGVLSGSSYYFNPARPDPAFYNGMSRVRPFMDQAEPVTAFPVGFYTTDAYSDRAIDFVRRARSLNAPFFLNLCYNAPHFPLEAPREDIARYQGKYRDGYESLRERRYRRQLELGIIDARATKLSPMDPVSGDYTYDYEIPDWSRLDGATRQREEERMEVYAAMVDRLDQGIGRVLKALEETGAAENTIVIVVSDNGGCGGWYHENEKSFVGFMEYNRGIPVGDPRGYEFVGPGWGWAQNAPFRHFKTWTYEGGIRTPMIVRWPGHVQPGTMSHSVGHLVDLMPTLIEAMGCNYPAEFNGHSILAMEGQNLMAAWRGKAMKPRSSPVFWKLFGNRAIRDGDWKLTWGASAKRWELYDLSRDQSETIDLAQVDPDRVTALATKWNAWSVSNDPDPP